MSAMTVKLGLIFEEQSRIEKHLPLPFVCAENYASTTRGPQNALDEEDSKRPAAAVANGVTRRHLGCLSGTSYSGYKCTAR